MWKECIDMNIKKKMRESTERIEARNRQREDKSKERDNSRVKDKVKAGKGFLGKTFSKIKNEVKKAVQSQDQKFSDEVLKHTNLIFNELSKYVQYLCNFGVKFE